MDVYRVSLCKYINDLTGTGAGIYGGRWNSKGTYLLYTSLSPSLALLENVVHFSSVPIENYCLAKWNIPEDKIIEFKAADLPADWSAYPPPVKMKAIGDKFVQDNIYLALKIPSAIMPDDFNILINPRHQDFKRIKIESVRNIPLDERLYKR